MLSSLLKLFQTEETQESIEPALAAAALLFEVAWADQDITGVEIESLQKAVREQFGIDEDQLNSIIVESEKVHESSVGVFPYTRAINEQLTSEEKVAIIKAMWQIAYADQNLDVFEEHTIRRIADLLYVSHQDFISTKLEVKALVGSP